MWFAYHQDRKWHYATIVFSHHPLHHHEVSVNPYQSNPLYFQIIHHITMKSMSHHATMVFSHHSQHHHEVTVNLFQNTPWYPHHPLHHHEVTVIASSTTSSWSHCRPVTKEPKVSTPSMTSPRSHCHHIVHHMKSLSTYFETTQGIHTIHNITMRCHHTIHHLHPPSPWSYCQSLSSKRPLWEFCLHVQNTRHWSSSTIQTSPAQHPTDPYDHLAAKDTVAVFPQPLLPHFFRFARQLSATSQAWCYHSHHYIIYSLFEGVWLWQQ